MSSGDYLLDNRAGETEQRFGALSAIFDPVTFRHVTALGIAEGWRCWEVGAGGPSVPSWLAERVGPAGSVLATDIDVSWIGDAGHSTFATQRHDVARDEPPTEAFDLVHARLVLSHIPERDEALRRMAGSLRPGGWLLIEDFDVALQPVACVEAARPEDMLANRIRAGFLELLSQRGVDPEYGRKLPRLLRQLRLRHVAADAYLPMAFPAARALDQANVTQVRDLLVAQGQATSDEVESQLAAAEGGQLDIADAPARLNLGPSAVKRRAGSRRGGRPDGFPSLRPHEHHAGTLTFMRLFSDAEKGQTCSDGHTPSGTPENASPSPIQTSPLLSTDEHTAC